MQNFLVVCRLEPAPVGMLPPWGGLLDVADEHGLFSLIVEGADVRRLSEGMLWGRFDSADEALEALEASLASASALLGYPIRARGRAASPIEGTDASDPELAEDSACSRQSSFIPIRPIGFLKALGRREPRV